MHCCDLGVHTAPGFLLEVLDVGGAGIAGADEDEDAFLAVQEVGHVGLDAVHAHVGRQCHVVGLELAFEMRPGIHLSSGGDISALDVGDSDTALAPDVLQCLGVGAQTLKPQSLVVGDLQLEAGTAPGSGVDDATVELKQRLAGHVKATAELGGQILERCVEADADWTARRNGVKQLVDDHVCSSCAKDSSW
jgi:hypothetical protein